MSPIGGSIARFAAMRQWDRVYDRDTAALKLMRKPLKKCGFVPDKLVTDDLKSYAAAASDLGVAR
jgi:hypothetical protein